MTPEEARELLEAATPGPWDCVGQDDEYPRVARDGYQDITNDATNFNAPLIAAAPALAETIAGLRYEYAVQVPVNGHWEYTKDDQYGPKVLRNPRDATWYSSRHAAETWADLWDDGEELPRIVHRLVSEPEVVE